jgi:hypothetical protein
MEKPGSQTGNMLPILKRGSATSSGSAGPGQLTRWLSNSSDKNHADKFLAEQLKSVQRNYEAISLMMQVKQGELLEVQFLFFAQLVLVNTVLISLVGFFCLVKGETKAQIGTSCDVGVDAASEAMFAGPESCGEGKAEVSCLGV